MENLMKHSRSIRRNIVKMVTAAASGHPGGSLSAVDILTVLYFKEMDINEENVNSVNRDRFVLSKGHASPLAYATLFEKGLCKEDLTTFRKMGSNLQGHPNMNYVPGIDMSTGSLGQGFSVAVGMAMANKTQGNTHRVYTLLGDGEIQEGQIWEAAMAGAHYKCDNLCAIVDNNNLQIDGKISDVMSPYPIKEKFEAFGWNVIEIDGHDYEQIINGFDAAKSCTGKPTLLLATTIKGKGVSFMENQAGWHGTAPSAEQCAQALEELAG